MSDKKIEFLYQSVQDTQGTIRAIDVKLGFLFVVMLLPIIAIPAIYIVYLKIQVVLLYKLLCLFSGLVWCMSLFLLFKGLISIKNPKKIIENLNTQTTCSFYDGDLYKFKLIDLFFNYPIVSNKTIEQKIEEIPSEEDEIIKALIVEKFKLAYIRDVKLKRSSLCILSTFVWVMLGSVLWSLSVFNVGL